MSTQNHAEQLTTDNTREQLEQLAKGKVDHPGDRDRYPNKTTLAEALVDAGVDAQPAGSGWGSKGYSGPQPWEDTEANQEPAEGMPILASGSAGASVTRLCQQLAKAGFETPVSRGENPLAVLGAGELTAVQAFRRERGVSEDPSAFSGGAVQAERCVGPWTWTALLEVA